jgi:hypothetical protein
MFALAKHVVIVKPARIAKVTQEVVWVTRIRRNSGAVECFKARGDVVHPKDKAPRFRMNSGDTIDHGNWHRTEAAALLRVKVLITKRQAMIEREAVTMRSMASIASEGRLPITRSK